MGTRPVPDIMPHALARHKVDGAPGTCLVRCCAHGIAVVPFAHSSRALSSAGGPAPTRHSVNKLDFKQTYTRWLRVWRRGAARRTAMEQAIGGEFEAFGILERELLIQHGLQPDAYVIDVGCGSGRLAKPLSTFLRGRYLGIDVVPGFVDYARSRIAPTGNSRWSMASPSRSRTRSPTWCASFPSSPTCSTSSRTCTCATPGACSSPAAGSSSRSWSSRSLITGTSSTRTSRTSVARSRSICS